MDSIPPSSTTHKASSEALSWRLERHFPVGRKAGSNLPARVGIGPGRWPSRYRVRSVDLIDQLIAKLTRDGKLDVGLCLSGGGYRAAAFHLGSLRRLAELNALAHVRSIGSVSGGSIVAGALAQAITKSPGTGSLTSEHVESAAASVAELSRRCRWVPFMGARRLAVALSPVVGGQRLDSILGDVDFRFCATDLANNHLWIFDRASMGNAVRGYFEVGPLDVASAVAASAAFPLAIGAFTVETRDLRRIERHAVASRRKSLSTLVRLVDGGAKDNLGLSALADHKSVLASNGGKVALNGDYARLAALLRADRNLRNHAVGLRATGLVHDFKAGRRAGAIWTITQLPGAYHRASPSWFSPASVRLLSRVRTSLDAFNEEELMALINHGYVSTNAALTRIVSGADLPNFQVPYPEVNDEVVASLLGPNGPCAPGVGAYPRLAARRVALVAR
jgi:NTE family protein